MISISLAAGATLVWFASLPVDQLPHHPRINPTGALAAAAQSSQERFEHARNAEIDASIAAVATRRAQERFEHARNAEIDASIAAVAAQRAQEKNDDVQPVAKDLHLAHAGDAAQPLLGLVVGRGLHFQHHAGYQRL